MEHRELLDAMEKLYDSFIRLDESFKRLEKSFYDYRETQENNRVYLEEVGADEISALFDL
jgi:hypothetical protein